jgi:hypothetical protein
MTDRTAYNRAQKRRRRHPADPVENLVRADTIADKFADRIADISRTFADSLAAEIVRFVTDCGPRIGGPSSPGPLEGPRGDERAAPGAFVRADTVADNGADTIADTRTIDDVDGDVVDNDRVPRDFDLDEARARMRAIRETMPDRPRYR